jgi:hypothetical protein
MKHEVETRKGSREHIIFRQRKRKIARTSSTRNRARGRRGALPPLPASHPNYLGEIKMSLPPIGSWIFNIHKSDFGLDVHDRPKVVERHYCFCSGGRYCVTSPYPIKSVTNLLRIGTNRPAAGFSTIPSGARRLASLDLHLTACASHLVA